MNTENERKIKTSFLNHKQMTVQHILSLANFVTQFGYKLLILFSKCIEVDIFSWVAIIMTIGTLIVVLALLCTVGFNLTGTQVK